MSVGIVWDERYAWHDAGRASNSPWAEPYPAFDRPESKRRLFSLVEASGLMDQLVRIPARSASEAELAGHRTAVENPLAAWYGRVEGQELQPHQEAAIDAIAEGIQLRR